MKVMCTESQRVTDCIKMIAFKKTYETIITKINIVNRALLGWEQFVLRFYADGKMIGGVVIRFRR